MKRGRKPDEVKSELVKIQGRRKRGASKRYDKTFAYLDNLQPGRRFEFVWELLTSAVNGELGQEMREAFEEINLDKAKEAARKIASNFVDLDE